MFAATIASSVLLAVALIPSARGKLVGDQRQIDGMRAVNFPVDKMWLLGAAEVAGAAGLVVGLFSWPVGAAAAICLAGYFIGALVYLLRARMAQARALAPAAVMLMVAIASLVLRIATSPMPAAFPTST
jgi:DoxX-like family